MELRINHVWINRTQPVSVDRKTNLQVRIPEKSVATCSITHYITIFSNFGLCILLEKVVHTNFFRFSHLDSSTNFICLSLTTNFVLQNYYTSAGDSKCSNSKENKKVLLRDRKRLITCSVASTHSLSGPGGGGIPDLGQGGLADALPITVRVPPPSPEGPGTGPVTGLRGTAHWKGPGTGPMTGLRGTPHWKGPGTGDWGTPQPWTLKHDLTSYSVHGQ